MTRVSYLLAHSMLWRFFLFWIYGGGRKRGRGQRKEIVWPVVMQCRLLCSACFCAMAVLRMTLLPVRRVWEEDGGMDGTKAGENAASVHSKYIAVQSHPCDGKAFTRQDAVLSSTPSTSARRLTTPRRLTPCPKST